MSHALTPTPTGPGSTTVTVPDGGDARTAASVTVPLQALTNLVYWICGVLLGTVNQSVGLLGSFFAGGGITTSASFTGVNAFLSGNVNAAGATIGTAHVTAALLQDGPVTFGGSGRAVPKTFVGAATVGMTAAYATASEYLFTSAAASSTIQIDATGVQPGDRFEFTNLDTANTVTIKNPSAGTITSIKNATGLNYSCTVLFDGTNYRAIRLWVGA